MPVMVPTLALEQPTFEHHPDGFGVHYRKPRISWRFIQAEGDQEYRGWVQTAYDLEVSRTSSSESHIFHVESEQSILVPWPAESLRSREAVTVRVRAYGKFTEGCVTAEANSAWSAPATVEAALLEMKDWNASFITSCAKFQEPNSSLRPIRFRKSFSLPPKLDILRARLYVTAYGVYEAYINGTRVGNHALAPGWQSYRHRLHYQTFDVSSLLNENNTLGIEAGEGWYVTRLGFFGGSRYIYGDEIAVLAQLEISLLSGESIFVKTDETWTCNPSPILTSEIYDGEVCDLRLDNENWTSFKLDEASTTPVRALPPPKATLVAPDAPPVRVTQEVEALNVIRTKSGKTIVDFGQNLAGVVRIRSLLLPAGKQVTLTHAEVMENGELGIRPLRHARARDIIISSGKEILSWSPKFTFHGFRYVQVDGWPGSPQKEDLTALVMHTDMRRRG